jgi:hypothetical protein
MDNSPTNRMNTTSKKRGRPPKEVVAARPEPTPMQPAAVTVSGLVCPCCGRAMVPKSLRVTDGIRYNRCTSCGGSFKVWLNDRGFRMVQPL